MRGSILLCLCLAGILSAKPVPKLGKVAVGSEFPEAVGFDLSRPGREETGPSGVLEDRKSVFVAFFQTTCAPCMAELDDLARRRSELEAKGVGVLLVPVQESRAEVRKFLQGRGKLWTFPVMADEWGSYAERVGVLKKTESGEELELPSGGLVAKGPRSLVLKGAWVGGDSTLVERLLKASP